MNARVFDEVICMIRCMVGFVCVWLGMFDVMLIARCMLVCV